MNHPHIPCDMDLDNRTTIPTGHSRPTEGQKLEDENSSPCKMHATIMLVALTLSQFDQEARPLAPCRVEGLTADLSDSIATQRELRQAERGVAF